MKPHSRRTRRVQPFTLSALTSVALAALLLLPFASPGAAQETGQQGGEEAQEQAAEKQAEKKAQPDIAFYGEVTSTATLIEQRTHDIAAPVLVIENLDERGVNNASDLLVEQPGVDVNGASVNQRRPVIRGQRGHRVLYLEDGLRMNNPRRQTDFGEITGLTDTENVKTVEVVRGPASVLWGSDAIGGVLNLITRVPAFGTSGVGGRLGLRYGTAGDQVKGSFSVAGGDGAWSYSLGATYRDVDDYDAPSGSFGAVNLADSTRVTDTGVQDESYNGYLGYRFSDEHSIFFKYSRYSADETGFGLIEPALLGETDRVAILYPFQDFDRLTFGYFGTGLGGVADVVDTKLYYQKNERELAFQIDSVSPFFPGVLFVLDIDTLNFTEMETFGFRGEFSKSIGNKQVLVYGGEYVDDDSFNTDMSVTVLSLVPPIPIPGFPVRITDDIANTPNATNTAFGGFLQDEITVNDRTRVTLGVRYNQVETQAEATPGVDITGLDFDDNDLVGAASVVFGVNDKLNLVASYGTAFRAPNIIERLFNGPTPEGFGFQITNTNLESEESENIDIGLKYLDENLFFELTYFDNQIDNGIVLSTLTPEEVAALPPALQDLIRRLGFEDVVIQQRNVDRLKFDGFEILAGYRFDNGVSLSFNATRLEGEREDSAESPTGDIANDKYNFFARYQPPSGRYWVEYHVRHQTDQDAPIDSDVGLALPSFTVHRLSGGYTVADNDRMRHSIVVHANNLSDELYAEFSNASFFRPEPERNYTVSYLLNIK